jgi:hypothetical protein
MERQLIGDVNNDGEIGFTDIVLIRNSTRIDLSPDEQLRGDANEDGQLRLSDANVIGLHITGKQILDSIIQIG